MRMKNKKYRLRELVTVPVVTQFEGGCLNNGETTGFIAFWRLLYWWTCTTT